MGTTIKVHSLDATESFDFDNKNNNFGLYRVTDGPILNGPPGIILGYGYALVLRYPASDTRIILAFPYRDVEMYIRSGSNKSGSTHKWNKVGLTEMT